MSLYEGKYFDVLSTNGWEFVHRTGETKGVGIIPITPENNLVLVKQFREPLQKFVIELPAGLVGDENLNETLVDGANRELLEETGYKAGKMRHVGAFSLSPGITSEIMTVFVATELTKIHDGGGVKEEGESIEIIEIPLFSAPREIMKLEDDATIIDFKTFLAVYFGVEEINRQIHAGETTSESVFKSF